MIDTGLLLSVILVVAVSTIVERWWPLGTPDGARFGDLSIGSAVGGLIAGRLAAVALDAPTSLLSIRDLMIIRSGVEFWPGALVAVLIVMLGARRARLPVGARVAAMLPLAMIGYATYEATCVVRDGCFGPVAPLGLRPSGLTATMVPVGIGIAFGVAGAASFVQRLRTRATPVVVSLAAVAGVSVPRAIGSVWLPHIGDGPTRQHLASIVIAASATTALIAVMLMKPRRLPSA